LLRQPGSPGGAYGFLSYDRSSFGSMDIFINKPDLLKSKDDAKRGWNVKPIDF